MTARMQFELIPEAQQWAHRRLIEAVRDHEDAVPCVVHPELWLSDDPEAAIQACLYCPVLDLCQKYVVTFPEPFGVWGATHPPEGKP